MHLHITDYVRWNIKQLQLVERIKYETKQRAPLDWLMIA